LYLRKDFTKLLNCRWFQRRVQSPTKWSCCSRRRGGE